MKRQINYKALFVTGCTFVAARHQRHVNAVLLA